MKDLCIRIVSIFASVLPKKNIICFESHSDFCDSSKALYELCISKKLNLKYRLIWFVDNRENFKNYKIKNVKFIQKKGKKLTDKLKIFYYKVFSRYCFYTHKFIGLQYNKGQIRYFLNHSSFPIKNVKGCYWNYEYNTYIEVTSDISAKYRAIALGGGIEKMKKLGLPRNDKLFVNNSNVLEKLNLDGYNNIIVWMPTFKHHKMKTRNDFENDRENDITLLEYTALEKINNYLNNNNSILLLKFHPAQDMNYVKSFEFSNILFLTNSDLEKKNVDLYELLGKSDALITDFSSVYFDYLLVNKPIGFELTDKEDFSKGRGFLVDNPLDFMPGEKIYNIQDLENFIQNVIKKEDKYVSERKDLLNLIHDYKDGNSSERILREVGII